MTTQTQTTETAGTLLPQMHRILALLGVHPEPTPPAPAGDDLAEQLTESVAARIAGNGRAAQLQLFGAPAIIPVCAHCHQPRSKVTRDRAELAANYPSHYPDGPDDACICCTPAEEYRCPSCHSEDLEFAMHYASASFEDGDETQEVAQCQECRWHGEAAECAPPVQPWAEMDGALAELQARHASRVEALVQSHYALRMPMGMEAGAAEYREVA